MNEYDLTEEHPEPVHRGYPLQVAPDWGFTGTVETLERELVGFEFRGPGIYARDGMCALVVPLDHEPSPWSPPEREGRLYRFHAYTAPVETTVLRYMVNVPRR